MGSNICFCVMGYANRFCVVGIVNKNRVCATFPKNFVSVKDLENTNKIYIIMEGVKKIEKRRLQFMNYTQPQTQPYVAPQTFTYRPQMWASQPQTIPQVRPVSSIEEVRAYPIDFDGSIFYFPDVANKKIYTKSINIDGTVAINLYELKTIADHSTDSSYVTRDEFNASIEQLKNLYEQLLCTTKEQEMAESAAQPQKPKFEF